MQRIASRRARGTVRSFDGRSVHRRFRVASGARLAHDEPDTLHESPVMPLPQQRAMTPREWGLMLALSLLWGGSFFFVGIIVKSLPPLTIVALRVSIAALVLWASGRWTGVSPRRVLAAFPSLATMGLLNNVVPFSLLVWAQTHLSSGLTAILNAATPVLTVIAAHFLTQTEKMTPRRIFGAALGFVGVAAMVGGDVASGLAGNALAEGACILAAAFYALSSIYARRFRAAGLAPFDIATGQLTASSLMLAPIAALVDAPWNLPMPGTATLIAILLYACLSTALAYIVYFRILSGAGATNVVLVTVLAPATTILLGAMILGERLESRDFLGLGLIALGIAFVDGRLPTMAAAHWRANRLGLGAAPD